MANDLNAIGLQAEKMIFLRRMGESAHINKIKQKYTEKLLKIFKFIIKLTGYKMNWKARRTNKKQAFEYIPRGKRDLYDE